MTPSTLKESWQMLDLSYNLENHQLLGIPGEQVNLMVTQKKIVHILK